MKTNLKELLDCAEQEMATATHQRLKDFEAELQEMLNDKTYANYHLPWFSVVREILG